jgi:Domain of unknown function (DUF2341)/Concanavalin A-like lectin/glucanases superfamily/Carbohydrate esterase, sialic acid-specific acetylesterase
MRIKALALATLALSISHVALAQSSDFSAWRHSGVLTLLTTPDGADLPATALERDFPVLVRLTRGNFDFSEATPDGADLRFTTRAGTPLAHQIEEWDPGTGTAAIWVRVPEIRGNAVQEIQMLWGNPAAPAASSGAAVFNASNGYLSVLHLNDTGESIRDEAGALSATNAGTTSVRGMIGRSRRFDVQKGIKGGEAIVGFPTGDSPHSSEAWFRADAPNSIILGWGNEEAQGKVTMRVASPPHLQMECYFSGVDVSGKTRLPKGQWVHAVHTCERGDSRIYLNGRLEGVSSRKDGPLAIKSPARMWLGGWYDDYRFVGDVDEVRISKVVRSADWVKLEYENQKPMQTLVGPPPRSGDAFSVTPPTVTVEEGKSVTANAVAGGARKVYWILKRDGEESVVAADQYSYTLDAGRVVGDAAYTLRFKAVYPAGARTVDIPVTVRETIPEPVVTLRGPSHWNGRDTVEVTPRIENLRAMKAKGAGDVSVAWTISGGAVISETATNKLILLRSQCSGPLTVTATVHNGGAATRATKTILVTEPERDPWIERTPDADEQPEDNQFYARNDKNEGTLHYNGAFPAGADAVFLKLYADDTLVLTQRRTPARGGRFAFSARLKPGLIRYKVEFGSEKGGVRSVERTVTHLVCGDAYVIDGQSNALATDTGEKSPPVTSEWIRSYGSPEGDGTGARVNRWCLPVWKAEKGEPAELGYWGMELAKRLVASQKVPIFIVNGAVGGTRIDQHQRNADNPTDTGTIYGRMLWRVRQAKLTHGIRAILWHQGESDQGADGPTGTYGWESYQDYFVAMSAGWKRDFPNVGHYYTFQIWPNSCSMGNGHGDMLREVQRTLPRLYSHMDVMSTLGIRPEGPCHYPLIGWAEFARLVQPLIERDFYGKTPSGPVTAPNLKRAHFVNPTRDAIAMEFDQPVAWDNALIGQFYLDEKGGEVVSGDVAGNTVTLRLRGPTEAKRITYLHEMKWSQDKLLKGRNGIAALSFCGVPVGETAGSGRPN